MRNEINLSDEQIEARFEENCEHLLSIEDLTFTRETIADFKAGRREWNEPGRVDLDEADELHIAKAQARKGEQRKDVIVIDFGNVRAVAMI